MCMYKYIYMYKHMYIYMLIYLKGRAKRRKHVMEGKRERETSLPHSTNGSLG